MNGLFGLIRIFSRIEKKLNQAVDILNLLLAFQRERQTVSEMNWLDNQDVMLKLKISDSTLRRLRDKGTIPYSRIHGKYYYSEPDILAVLSAGANTI